MIRRAVPCMVLVALAGCMEGQKDKPLARSVSLYQRLGGEPGLKKIVEDYVTAVLADAKVPDPKKKTFKEGDVSGLKRKLVERLSQAAGGPPAEVGKLGEAAGPALGLSGIDFDTKADDLVQALRKNDVGPKEREELITLLRPRKID